MKIEKTDISTQIANNEITSETILDNIKKECEEVSEEIKFQIESNLKAESDLFECEDSIKYEEKIIFYCDQCSKSFNYIELYELHALTHTTLKKMKKCPYCKFKQLNIEKFTSHIQKHIEQYQHCQFCNKLFFNSQTLKLHESDHKRNGALICSYCSKTFKSKKSLTLHIRVHTNERPYQCDMCENSFKQLNSLRTHQLLIHSIGKPQECNVCHGKFCTKSSLNRHMKMHSTGRSIYCKACKMDFQNKELYTQHRMEVHTRLKLFYKQCADCNEDFSTFKKYYDHRKRYHGLKKMPPRTQKCYLCGEEVPFKNFLEHKSEHMLLTLDEMRECEKAKKFVCKICNNGFNFSGKKCLLEHMDIHMEKTYLCQQCGNPEKWFTYLGLRKHERGSHATIVKCSSEIKNTI